MQRVVRSSLIGLLAMAGLTACGDKVELQGPTTTPPSLVVRSVTVTPPSATLNQGDKITLAASVNADAGVTDRTVTWRSGNTAIASVDANGVVTAGTTAGTTTITALAKADTNVRGASVITVNAASVPGGGAPATVTISTINQTSCAPGGGSCTSVPANLGNVAGQIDVTMNVDPGAQRLVGVDLVLNCTGNGNSGQDTVVASQTLAAANVSAEAASAPVTLSFNTATFNSTTGATAFRNGQCTLKGRARTNSTPGGAITTVTSTGSAFTLNNTDVVIGSITPASTKINPVTGAAWGGGATVTVTVTPVMYSGRVPASTNVTFAGVTSTTPSTSAGTSTFVFNNGLGAAGVTNNIFGQTNPTAGVTFTLVDANGNTFTNPAACAGGAGLCSSSSVLAGAAAGIASIQLDTQKPLPGTFATTANPDQGINGSGYVGANFRFAADSAAGYRGPNAIAGNQTQNLDNGGVDNVTVVFQQAPSGTSKTSSTWAAITTPAASNLAETVSSTSLIYRMLTTDALGNTDTSANSGFGVDKTAPINTQTGTANQTTGTVVGGSGNITATIQDALSGAAPALVAQTILYNGVVTTSTSQPANNTIYTNTGAAGTSAVNAATTSGCIIGRFNRLSGAANADTTALPVFNAAGTQVGTCSPTPYNLAGGSVPSNASGTSGYVTTRIVAVDQAGNRATPTTVTIVEDPTAPTVGSMNMPASATGGAALTIPTNVLDALDVTATGLQITYNGIANTFQYPLVAGPGTAFDNSLQPGSTTTPAVANPSIPFFYRNIKTGAAGALTNPTQAANGANTVAAGAVDEVGNAAIVAAPITLTTTTTVAQPGTSASANPWATDFTGGLSISANNTAVSNCPTAGCTGGATALNPLSTTLTVTAQGNAGTFANPFTNVSVWYQVNGAGPYFFAGNTGGGLSRDTGIGGFRFWDYTFTFTPPKTAQRNLATGVAANLTATGTTLNFIGIGSNANGDALVTGTPVTVTLTNP